jgi:SPP1 gp7 family putative phage head morphogenesis protein
MASQLALAVDALPKTRRPRRIRPARFPLGIERRFVVQNRRLIQSLGAMVDEMLLERLGEIANLGGFRLDAERFDQSPWRALLNRIFGDIRDRWQGAADLARQQADEVGREVSQHNRLQIARQMRQAVGVDIFFEDPGLLDTLEEFTERNVSRITTAPANIFPRLEQIVSQGFRRGQRPAAISAQIVDQLGIEENRAAFWARDQVGTLNGQLTQQRHESLGLESYIWRTSLDERVRASHMALEGSTQRWDDPPTVGKRQVHPGEDYSCRCGADPIIPGIPNEKTSPADVPRNPKLVKQAAERRKRARERNAKRRLTGGPAL